MHPLPFETYGRLGTDGRRTLEVLAAHAGACLGDSWALPRLGPLWHAALERVVHFNIAEVDLLALGYSANAVAGCLGRPRAAVSERGLRAE